MVILIQEIEPTETDMDSLVYVDRLIEKEKYSRLKLIDGIESKAGTIISVIALILTLEVTLVLALTVFTDCLNVKSALVVGLYILHIGILAVSAVLAIMSYNKKRYYALYCGEKILNKICDNIIKSKKDILFQNISNNVTASNRLKVIRYKKQRMVRASLILLMISEIPFIILLIMILILK